jgi:cytochrome oxidase Cu insertion factor (SCO1/SenC/PrrC family)
LNAGCSKPASLPDDFGPLPDFQLTANSGNPITLNDLAGKTWVAAFVFTRCAGPCPQISGSMAQLQERLKDLPNVRLVSFSVDPEHDSAEVLTTYGKKFGAVKDRWLFVTGEEKPVYELLRKGFKVGVDPSAPAERKPGNEVTHSTKLVLVDRAGHIRGYFDGLDAKALDELVKQVRLLDREKP